MTDMRWEISPDFPSGHLVPLTTAEQTQLDTDRTAAATAAATTATTTANQQTLQQAVQNRLAGIRTARQAIAAGTIFAGLTANEKAVIDGLLQDDLRLIRLVTNLYDATN